MATNWQRICTALPQRSAATANHACARRTYGVAVAYDGLYALQHMLSRVKNLQVFHTDSSPMCTRFLAIFDWSFGWGCETPIQGKGQGGGWVSRMIPSKKSKSVGEFLQLPSPVVTLPLSLRVSEILPLLYALTFPHPTTPTYIVSPNNTLYVLFWNIPMWSVWYSDKKTIEAFKL